MTVYFMIRIELFAQLFLHILGNERNLLKDEMFMKKTYPTVSFCLFFERSTFVGSASSFDFFIPATTANDLRLRSISMPDIIHYSILLS